MVHAKVLSVKESYCVIDGDNDLDIDKLDEIANTQNEKEVSGETGNLFSYEPSAANPLLQAHGNAINALCLVAGFFT